MSHVLIRILKNPSTPGILLVIAALLALVIYNSPLANWYETWLHTPVSIYIGDFSIDKDLRHWIDDGLMMIFFLLIGLELKREFFIGELKDPKQILLPAMAALGGMLVPALIYVAFNYNDPESLRGWAIPSATDIAFAIGVLSLLGNRIPLSLKVFLVTLAVLDDLGAILIIALFYSSELSGSALIMAALFILILFSINMKGVKSLTVYGVVGVLLWASVIKSGVHATLAGVIIAFSIPLRVESNEHDHCHDAPLIRLEHELQPWVSFLILPLFAFANAGVPLSGITIETLTNSVILGTALGLFIGKQLGVFGFSYLAVKLGWANLPRGISWLQLYGVSILAGIGFTMSLFIGTLAFEQYGGNGEMTSVRLGILISSFLSAIIGFIILHIAAKRNPEK